ncbi:MAG: DUF2085 domain-containing protein [Ignavibacteriae bacterium]|nr:DUF2085 domain-containing protein [Ignavibacteriota bacterium]
MVLLTVNVLNIAAAFFTLSHNGSALHACEDVLNSLCHRMPSRSFWIREVPFGLCSRCTGIYSGSFIVLASLPLIRKRYLIRFGLAAVLLVPMIVDGLSQHFGLYTGSNELRFLTGLIFGSGLFILLSILGEVIINHSSRTRRTP